MKILIILITFAISSSHLVLATPAPSSWLSPKVPLHISKNILYLPIAHEAVKSISIDNLEEGLVDLLEINNPRIKPLSTFNTQYQNTYKGYSNVRVEVYKRLLAMLQFLPPNIGIAYFEALRPLAKQKEYFDKKFKEILAVVKDKEIAYQEASKHVSPFIDNIPTHSTGAAIDITLFSIEAKGEKLLDMGIFGTIHGHNNQQETFSKNTSLIQRQNRLMLLQAATKAGLVNYGFEWWHYSYGDKAWAYVKKQKAIYGLTVEKTDPILLLDKKAYLESFDNKQVSR